MIFENQGQAGMFPAASAPPGPFPPIVHRLNGSARYVSLLQERSPGPGRGEAPSPQVNHPAISRPVWLQSDEARKFHEGHTRSNHPADEPNDQANHNNRSQHS